MLMLRDPAAVGCVQEPVLRSLLAQRFKDIAQDEPYDPDELGYFAVVEPQDSIESIERETGLILHIDEDDGFVPLWEFVMEFPCCYEAVFVTQDSGYGITLWVPKQPTIDQRLLALCQQHAIKEADAA